MQVTTHSGSADKLAVDLIVLGVFSAEPERAEAFVQIDRALGGVLRQTAREQDFSGKPRQRLVLHTFGKLKAKRVGVLGMGNRSGAEARRGLLRLGAWACRLGNGVGARRVAVVLPDARSDVPAAVGDASETTQLVARGVQLGAYRFDRYRSDKGRKPSVRWVSVGRSSGRGLPAAARAAVRRGTIVGRAVSMARDLVNESALDLYPQTLARRAQQVARRAGLTCKIYAPNELERMGMRLLLGVGQGSERTPRLVHLTYTPTRQTKRRQGGGTVLVGKGITFDSGGLCLKSSGTMGDMKGDMAGAAAVLATAVAAAELKLSKPLHAVLALAENMPSGSAVRPGDVLRSAAGKTVEVTNTDAEGRLVLADALHFAAKLKPDRIVDVATLTGACVVALGPQTMGLFCNSQELADELLQCAERAGEDLWQLPLTAALREQLDSDVADLRNTGERWGGAITAALFLKEFVGTLPWAHLDIAGPGSTHKAGLETTKGGTGVAVATLVDWLG